MFTTLTAARRLPTLAGASRRFASSVKEGSVAQSQGFSKKEKAHEDEYARRHEAELLSKLKKEIEAKKQELAELEEKHAEEAAKTK